MNAGVYVDNADRCVVCIQRCAFTEQVADAFITKH